MIARAGSLLLAVALGVSTAIGVVPSVSAEGNCTTNCPVSGSSTPTSITLSTSGDIAFPGTPSVNAPGNPPGSRKPAACTGPGWLYYGLGLQGRGGFVLSGVNIKPTDVIWVGQSPISNNLDYSQAPYNKLQTYPNTVNAAQLWYAAWEGAWTPKKKSTSTAQYGWVESNPPVTKASATQPAGNATTKWVQDGTVRAGRQTIPLWVEYLWEQTGTTTTSKVTGCSLQGIGMKYFYPVTPCVSAACIGSQLPPLGPSMFPIANQLRTEWTPGYVTSAPPSQAITVWVPTIFSLAGGNMPPIDGATRTVPKQVAINLDGSPRILTVQLVAEIMPQYVDWTYVASGAQSGAGFTCTVQTPPYQSYGGQNLSNCNTSPNVGYPSSAGYVFTHDANHLVVTASVELALSGSAIWVVPGTTCTASNPCIEGVSLGGSGSEVLDTQTPLIGQVQQVEGVTTP